MLQIITNILIKLETQMLLWGHITRDKKITTTNMFALSKRLERISFQLSFNRTTGQTFSAKYKWQVYFKSCL